MLKRLLRWLDSLGPWEPAQAPRGKATRMRADWWRHPQRIDKNWSKGVQPRSFR